MIRFQIFAFLMTTILGSAANAAIENKRDLFGTSFVTISNDKARAKEIDAFLKTNAEKYQASFDPDCIYKEKGNKNCGKQEPSKEVLALIEKIQKETKGAFTLTKENEATGEKKRDFGGIAEGAVLDELAQKFPTNWFGNFSGDIYIAPETKREWPVFINEPLVPTAPFAKVEIESGWIMGSSSPTAGGEVHDKSKTKFDFDRIVLFAHPNFSGARLNAWSVALVTGGKELLRHLLSLDEYKGRWSFLYFEEGGNVVCAAELKCNLNDPKNRTIKVSWKK